MTDLPGIPAAAVEAAVNRAGTQRKLEAAWPHLYAAALRHAADEVEELPWYVSGPPTFAQHLRILADEAASPEALKEEK